MSALRTVPLMTRLNQEWATSYVDRDDDFGTLGVRSGGELLEEIRTLRCQNSNSEVDALLHELLRLAHDGNHAAERVLVQLLIPVAQRMAHRVTTLDDLSRMDRVGYAIGCAWEAIRSYEMHRRQKVYANLTMTLLGLLAPQKRANDREIHDRTVPVDGEVLMAAAGAAPVQEVPAEVRLARLFAWAGDASIITSDEVALLARVALGDETQKQVAADLGVSEDCLRKRAARIRDRISRAVLEQAS